MRIVCNIIFLAALVIIDLTAATIVPGGDISGTWTAENSPYMIQNNCNIVDLTIEPGVEVHFTGNYKFEVSGSLRAQGFYSDSIIFKPDSVNTASWVGIKFKKGSYSSSLEYCRIVGTSNQGAIQIDQATPYISHCRLVNNQSDGIYLKDASIQIHHCIIYNNSVNGVVLDGGQITGTNIIIAKNTLAGITATHNDDSALLTNCVIADNGTDGITATNGTVTVQNSIIFGNQTSVNGTILVTFSCIEGDSLYPGTGNIKSDPQFADHIFYDLEPQSACIDSGTTQILQSDRYFPPSQGGIRNDMGAYGGPGAGGWYPPLYIVPQEYDFGPVTIDSSQSIIVNAHNYRDIAISTVLITFIPGTPAVFSSDFSPFTVQVLESEPIKLTFTPAAVQSYNADMLILTSAHGTVSIPVHGNGVVSDIDLASNLLDFGIVAVGDSLIIPLHIQNTGTDTLRLSAQPPASSVFSFGQTDYIILPNGGMDSILVKLKPVSIENYKDSLIVYSNDPDENPAIVYLTGTGSAARIVVDPETVDFDSVSIGDFADDSISISNTGNSDLVITEIRTDNSVFVVIDPPLVYPFIVEPGNTEKFVIRFTPDILGPVTDNLIINSNSIDEENKLIPLAGTGTGALVLLSSNSLDYGNVPLFSDSIRYLILHSAGNEPVIVQDIYIDNITIDSAFTIINSVLTMPFTILPAQDTTLIIRYEAKNIGSDSGRIDIVCQNPDIIIPVILSGTGRAPIVSATEDSLNFGSVFIPFESVQTITFNNNGNSELLIQSIDFTGQSPDSIVFAIVNPDGPLPYSIPAGDSLNLEIQFGPMRVGYVYTDLLISTNDPRTPELTIFLSGTGLIPSLLISDTVIEFGSVTLYTQAEKTIKLTNKGNTPIVIQDLSIVQQASDFEIIDTSFILPYTLSIEEMIEVGIRFTPSLRVSLTGELIITSNTPGLENISVDLKGTGCGAIITYTPGNLDFKTVLIGREKVGFLNIINTGNDTLIIHDIQFADQDPDSIEFDTLSTRLPLRMYPDSSTTIPFVFRPMQETLITSYVDIYSNDPDSSIVRVELSGTGISTAPILSLSQTKIDFGQVQVSATHNAILSIENAGNEYLTISELHWYDSNPDTVFRQETPIEFPIFMEPGNHIDLSLQFAPNREGSETGYLQVISNDPTSPRDSVFLYGTGIQPHATMQISLTILDFGRVLVTKDSLLSLTVRNLGYSDLIIPIDSMKFVTEGDNNFVLSNQTDLSIAHADSGSIFINFAPQTSGPHSNTLLIGSNDPDYPVAEIHVSGEGYVDEDAHIAFDPLNSSSSFVKDQPATISFIITDVSHVDSGFIYLRDGGAAQYERLSLSAHINGQNWYRQISSNQITERGLQYYVCVIHNHDSTLYPVNGALEPQSIQVTVPEQPFPHSTPQEEYQLISIPLTTSNLNLSSFNMFGDDLGPYDDTKYRIFEIVNRSTYEELRSMNKPLPPGKAVWLITKDPTELDISNAQSVSTAVLFPLTLTEGWNLIGSPFAFTVDWSTVSDEFKLRNYTGSGWGFTDVLSPYSGCTVYVPRDTVLLIIPQEAEPGVTKPRNNTEMADDWHVRLSVTTQSHDDRYNYAGASPGATDLIDRWDYPEPPVIGDFVSLYFIHADDSIGYSTDYRQSGADGYTYEFELSSSGPKEKKIVLNLENLPSDFEWAVVSPETYTLFRNNSFTTSARNARFKLIIGRESYVSANITGLSTIPEHFDLTQNFPNPFNPETRIRLQLPVATDVSVHIYNILGQKVRTLLSGVPHEEGTYFYEWKGLNDHGQFVASGVYILHLSTPEYKRTIKMLLQK